jgi:outer membrane protein insertion porin family
LERRDFLISFIEPWFLDYQLQFGVEGYYRDSQYYSDEYDQRNAGGSFFFRKPLGEFSSIKAEYRGEQVDLFNLDDDASEEFLLDEGSRIQSSITVSYAYDRRDSSLLTRRGTRFDAFAGYMGGPLGGDTDLYTLGAEVSHYIPLPFDTIFLINAEVSFVDSDNRVPVYNRLYLGGANSLRGFDYRDVGPKDENGEPVGGLSMARLTLEYTFPIIKRVRGAVFYDVGFVDEDSFKFGSDLSSDFGVGVRLDLPIGPVRIDVGFPLQAEDDTDNGARFNFNVGYQF